MKDIGKVLLNIISKIAVLWVPFHIDKIGNKKVEDLAEKGALMNQEGILVTSQNKVAKWSITHRTAKEMYDNWRSPKFNIEKKWPTSMRSL